MEPEIEETLQFQSMLADYNDRAFEIEVESEMNAAKLKRKMIKEEKELICKQKNDEYKLLQQNLAIEKSALVSNARKQIMEETKHIFEDVDRNATQEISNYIAQHKDKYLEFIDKIVVKSVAVLGKSGIIQGN